jgi:hypothetical protein
MQTVKKVISVTGDIFFGNAAIRKHFRDGPQEPPATGQTSDKTRTYQRRDVRNEYSLIQTISCWLFFSDINE